jgi:guanine deaminase
MIIAGQMLLTDSPSRTRLAPGWVRVEGGKMAEVGAGACPHRVDIGGDGWVVTPGFVDAHLHLPQFDVIGVDGLPLLEWLNRAVFPAEARWADAGFAGAMGERVAKRLLSHGTTAVAAYGTVHHDGTAAAMRAVAEAGLRGVVGQVLMDRGAPAELVRPAAQLVREAEAMKGVGRIAPAVTPRFAVSCSAELLTMAGGLAEANGQVVQTHLSETEDECRLVGELFEGRGYLEVYERAGLLTARTVFGHGIWLSDAERARIASAGGVVAHCPTANLFLGAGAMSRTAAMARGVRLALGSDVAGGPDVSMVRVARGMIETAKRLRAPFAEGEGNGGPLPTAAECWWRITRGNAEAIGIDGGRIAVGADADLVVFRPDVPLELSPDPLSMLLYGWDERWIGAVIVGGRVVE